MRMLVVFFIAMLAYGQQCRLAPVTPAQPEPRVEEGERATESQTFQTTALALSPDNLVHFFDTANRIRRIDGNGRMRTLAGTGDKADLTLPGVALETPLAAVTQILFSPAGVLHFASVGRVFRVADGKIEAVAGSGKPGFNVEAGPATEVNLNAITNAAFDRSGRLLILDGFNRLRRLEADGVLRTIAGSVRPSVAAGRVGDDGPAVEAALSSPRQVIALNDGSLWIRDLSGRHLRIVTPDGLIDTVNANFEASINILLLPDGTPAAATANRLYPIRANGTIETGGAPFAPFTGTPLAVTSDRKLLYLGGARPEQRNPLVRLDGRVQSVLAGAPVAPVVDGQAPPFGIWDGRRNTLIYSALVGGKFVIFEARAGGAPRILVGGGADVGDADGKEATSVTMYGILAFSMDGEGRIAVADVNRRRIFVMRTDGKLAVLKAGGEEVVYAPTGSLSTLQRIASDNAGNIYWFSQGATPTGGVFTAEISVWMRASSTVQKFTVTGLAALGKLEDGSVAVIAGNATNFRTAYQVAGAGQGEALPALRMLPLQSVTRWKEEPFFTAASRLFRGAPGRIRMLDFAPLLAKGAASVPDFVMASPDSVLVHLNDGGFYRIENIEACRWITQPSIASNGLVNAASYGFTNTISPRQLVTVYGSGLGPEEGQGFVLDGALRAAGQPAPYPTLSLGNFSGAIPLATLTGTAMPVLHSNDSQVTAAAVAGVPASGTYLLYFGWQGLQLIHPETVRVQAATPGLFTASGAKDGPANAQYEDGTRNTAENAAGAGTVVQLFATGLGALSGNPALGEFFGAASRVATANAVTVTIGGTPAEVVFAGGAPGMVGGMYRVDVVVPEGLEAGARKVVVEVAGVSSEEQDVTVFVK
ncbi:MAG: hypothetical protein JNK48_34370 [Bryobacterales bacterium]|nr:hypothetical protein [Bryobacterales bacterium]